MDKKIDKNDKKILILVDTLKIGGGSDKFAAVLGSELYDKGYHVSYLTLNDDDPKYDFKGDYYTLKMNNIYGNNLKRGFDLLRYPLKIKRICEDLDIDTLISAGDPSNFHALFSKLLFRNKVHLIISQHMNPEIFLESPLKFRLIKFFFPRADEIVCVSKEIERILKEDYKVKNTQTIYNMIDLEGNLKLSTKHIPEEFRELFNENSYFNFINIGRLDRQKGQWFLIRSFRAVVDKHENARLFILGQGDLREDLEGLINDLDLAGKVFLLGEQENVFPFLRSSDCFVFSSLWEGFGLVLVEALSMNLPVVSTDCKSGPREVLSPELGLDEVIDYPYFGKHAILTQNFQNELIFKNINDLSIKKSEKILADVMIKIIEDSEFRIKYSKGQVIAKNFDKEKIINKWITLLKNDK